MKRLVTDKTCAIILEPLQGEGGINEASQEFMEGIREICDEEGILMICDEIQCGMARTGNMFAWQGYGVKPDIMAMAKAIGSGVPVGAFAMTEEVAEYSLSRAITVRLTAEIPLSAQQWQRRLKFTKRWI